MSEETPHATPTITLQQISFDIWCQRNRSLALELVETGEEVEINCPDCDGEGEVDCECDECGDEHKRTCKRCDGDGMAYVKCTEDNLKNALRQIYNDQAAADQKLLSRWQAVAVGKETTDAAVRV